MRTMCEINRLIETGEITSFAQKAPHDVYNMDQGKYHGSIGMVHTPSTKEPFYYQVFKLGDKDRQVIAHGMQTGRTWQLIQQGGLWNTWKETDGRSAYQTWLDEGHTGNKAAFLASLKGVKGDAGSFAKTGFATHAEVVSGVNTTKPINPAGLNWGALMSKGGSPTDKFIIPDKANLNSYTTLGMYHQAANAWAATGSNYPHKLAGMLTVMDGGSSFVYQTYRIYTPSMVYARTYHNTEGWSHWRRLDERFDPSAPLPYKADPTPADFNNLVIGQSMFVHGKNTPASAYVHCIGNRDSSNGKGFIAMEYGSGRVWMGFAPNGGVPAWRQLGLMSLSGTTLTITL